MVNEKTKRFMGQNAAVYRRGNNIEFNFNALPLLINRLEI